jgi:hypothetical protein
MRATPRRVRVTIEIETYLTKDTVNAAARQGAFTMFSGQVLKVSTETAIDPVIVYELKPKGDTK